MDNKGEDLQTKLVNVSKQYATEIIAPFKKEIRVNIYISGSVSYGFCDELSDLEMEFYFPAGNNPATISKVEQAIECMPVFEGIQISAGISRWPLEQVVKGNLDHFWSDVQPYTLYELITALPVDEDIPLLAEVKKKIPFYPKEIAQKVIRGLWLTINDSGAYNADYAYKRNELVVSDIFFFKAMEALLRLLYIANEKYYPHTKWLVKGIPSLTQDFGITDLIANLLHLSIEEKFVEVIKVADKLSSYLVEKGALEQEYKYNPWGILKDEYYIFSTF